MKITTISIKGGVDGIQTKVLDGNTGLPVGGNGVLMVDGRIRIRPDELLLLVVLRQDKEVEGGLVQEVYHIVKLDLTANLMEEWGDDADLPVPVSGGAPDGPLHPDDPRG